MQIEEDIAVECPFCLQEFSLRIDRGAGNFQDFIYDCELCCRPIRFELTGAEEEVPRLIATRDD